MNLSARNVFAMILIFAGTSRCTALASAQAAYRFDAATVSGLSARNIGSATMSGRIAAIDAIDEKGRITVFAGAASGGVWKSVNGGTTFKPVFERESVQSIVLWRLILRIQETSGWEPASRGYVTAFRSATEFTNL